MPTVGLSMIVKNAEMEIAHCINSVKSVVDQIVVMDTGSTDRTQEIATRLGAEVYSIPWENDFAKARNAAIDCMTTDWILSLDADEELSKEASARLRSLLKCNRSIGGYHLRQRNYQFATQIQISGVAMHPWTGGLKRAESAKQYYEIPLCRLFRRHSQIRYSNRVHEIPDPQILALGMRIEPTDLIVHHFGYLVDAKSQHSKNIRNFELLKQALTEDPNNSWNWLQLGLMQETILRDAAGAMQSYHKSSELTPNNLSWLCLASLRLQLNQNQEAINEASHLPGEGAIGVSRNTIVADALCGLGKLDEARRVYTETLELVRANPALNGVGSNLLLENRLGYTEVRLGMADAGLEKLNRTVAANPGIAENSDRLMKAFMLLQRHTDAAEAAEAAIPYAQSESVFSRAAALRLHAGGKEQAQKILDDGLKRFPNSKRLQELRASIL